MIQRNDDGPVYPGAIGTDLGAARADAIASAIATGSGRTLLCLPAAVTRVPLYPTSAYPDARKTATRFGGWGVRYGYR